MPATPPPEVRRGKVPQALFWAGMGLAPLAVLILLFGQSTGSLRIAVVLAVLTIVMLAVSIAMRPSVDLVRVDIEHRVLDEMERIRLRAREETAAAARNSHRALTERIAVLNATVEHLQAQVDDAQANAAHVGELASRASGYLDPAALGYHAQPALDPPAPPGTVRRTETVHVTRRTTYDDTGTVYGSRAAYEHGSVDGEWREERDDPDERSWSIGRPDQPALPAARGEGASRFYDRSGEHEPYGRERMDRDRDHGYDRERGYDRDRGYERERGYDRERGHDRDRGYDRERDGRGRDDYDRGHDRDRGYDRDRGFDREPDRGYGHDRGSERGYDREPEREHAYDRRHDRDRGYDREPGYDRGRGYEPRGHESRGYEPRGYDGERGHDRHDRDPDRGWERPPVPRPRYPQW